MPNNYDFTVFKNINELPVSPEGWKSPLLIEYATEYHGDVPSCFWRVKGTKHTFIIPLVRLNYLSAGDYAKHFKDILELFREDYFEWKEQGFAVNWMSEYKSQFAEYINI